MARWADFEAQVPELAAAGRALIYQFGVGLSYLATVRPDGGPRVHPICPIIVGGGLYGLIVRSPKQQDLFRDSRYALHTFSSPNVDDEFYLTGKAVAQNDLQLISVVRAAQRAAGGSSTGEEALFEFLIERALYSKYKPRGTPDNWPPQYLKWVDSSFSG